VAIARGGKSWSHPVRINDVAGSAREGLHAMASDGKGLVFAAWLDLREKGTRIYGAASTDGGVTWSDQLVYASPSGTVCQCCHPSVAVDARGAIYVMFRNAVEGSRDLYLTRSDDGGKTFGAATKLGRGTWTLDACPMDGGGLAVDRSTEVTTVWRRGSTVFATSGAGPERALGNGKNPTVAATRNGAYFAWTDDGAVLLKKPGVEAAESIDAAGAYPSMVALGDEAVVVAWESKGAIMLRTHRAARQQ
jgi:BNR repeat protein